MSTTRDARHAGRCGIGSPASAASRLSTAIVRHPRARARRSPSRRAGRRAGSARSSSGSSARQRLGVGDVERGAGDLAVVRARARSASWSTIAAAGGVDEVARSASCARARRSPIRWRVSGVSGTCSETKSARSSSSSSGTPRAARCGGPPSRSPRRGAPPPGRCGPQPTIPSVAPARSAPRIRGGLPRPPLALAHLAPRPRGSRRASASSSAKARSAVASVSTSGVLPTGMPRAAAASRSMLSVPTAVVRDRPQPRRGVEQRPVDAVGDERQQPVRVARALAQRSAGGGSRSGHTSTSCAACRRSSAGTGSRAGDRSTRAMRLASCR